MATLAVRSFLLHDWRGFGPAFFFFKETVMFEPNLKTSQYLYHPDAWPVITHLDDILPLVADNPGIRLFKHDSIQVLRYLINSAEVFTTPADLEARGLIFALDGTLLSRPLHKFFNIFERADVATLASHGPGHLETKLDGSMIAAFLLNDTLTYHTKGGVSRQAMAAGLAAPKNVHALARAAIEKGYTPIFEWTGPENRIVIAYDVSQMRLLTLRHRETGVYNDDLAKEMAAHYGVAMPDIIAHIQSAEDLENALSRLTKREDIEGAVYVGPDGLRAKAKTASYLLIHKTLSQLSFERHALRAVLEEIDDDLLPLLSQEQRTAWENYASQVRRQILAVAQQAQEKADNYAHLEGKEAATAIGQLEASLRPLVFAAKQDKDVVATLISLLGKHMGSDTRVQAIKTTYDLPDWSPDPGLFLKE